MKSPTRRIATALALIIAIHFTAVNALAAPYVPPPKVKCYKRQKPLCKIRV